MKKDAYCMSILQVVDLRTELEARGASCKGLKAQLQAKLSKLIKVEMEAEEEKEEAAGKEVAEKEAAEKEASEKEATETEEPEKDDAGKKVSEVKEETKESVKVVCHVVSFDLSLVCICWQLLLVRAMIFRAFFYGCFYGWHS